MRTLSGTGVFGPGPGVFARILQEIQTRGNSVFNEAQLREAADLSLGVLFFLFFEIIIALVGRPTYRGEGNRKPLKDSSVLC